MFLAHMTSEVSSLPVSFSDRIIWVLSSATELLSYLNCFVQRMSPLVRLITRLLLCIWLVQGLKLSRDSLERQKISSFMQDNILVNNKIIKHWYLMDSLLPNWVIQVSLYLQTPAFPPWRPALSAWASSSCCSPPPPLAPSLDGPRPLSAGWRAHLQPRCVWQATTRAERTKGDWRCCTTTGGGRCATTRWTSSWWTWCAESWASREEWRGHTAQSMEKEKVRERWQVTLLGNGKLGSHYLRRVVGHTGPDRWRSHLFYGIITLMNIYHE